MVDIYNKKNILTKQIKYKDMAWTNQKDSRKKIAVSRCKFPQNDIYFLSMALKDLTLENCPISIEEFEDYQGISSDISRKGIDKIKEFFFSKGGSYICFVGLYQKARHV